MQTRRFAAVRLAAVRLPWMSVVRAAGCALGCLIVVLAIASFATQMTVTGMLALVGRYFGPGFTLLLLALGGTSLYATWRMPLRRHYWHEVASQCAGGIATLALTFTLLGISLGIGSLAEQAINPETVQDIIKNLTRHFSTAFMTTVVGLPVANLLRACAALRNANLVEQLDSQEKLA